MQGLSYKEMPGRIISMSGGKDKLFVLCSVDRPWWAFWRPRQSKKLFTFTGDDFQ